MRRCCPWCREPLGSAGTHAARCPHCDRPLVDEQGGELRDIDLRYERVEARLWERYRRMMMIGVPAIALVSLATPALPVTAIALAPLLTVAHLIAVRLCLVREPRRLLSTARRGFLRWLSRLGFLWLGVPGYALSAVPLVGVVAAVATYGGLTTGVWSYTRWSLAEERDREPLAAWERWVLWGLVVATLVVLAAIAAVATAVGWSVAALLSK